jgi:hypothetical protein
MNESTESNQTNGHAPDDSANPTDAAPDAEAGGDTDSEAGRASGREILAELQVMIDDIATQAGPWLREVAAKAAELAAVAGERAGPLAQRAAEATGRVGERVAVRSKEMAAELRSQPTPTDAPAAAENHEADG